MSSVFAIGDVQGCLGSLNTLIKKLPRGSKLIFLGDLVNRGPDSLGSLRRLKQLQETGVAECILGNHDLNLLACDAGIRETKPLDTIDDVLSAPDRRELIDWLRYRPMALSNGKVLLVHAGVLPQWSLKRTLSLAHEVESTLRHKKYQEFLVQMYGNTPNQWDPKLSGMDRLRLITNTLTRIRFCTPGGEMEFKSKEGLESGPAGYIPWFETPKRKTQSIPIVFGHWSTLGLLNRNGVVGIDTGCVWGGTLTALDLNHLETMNSAGATRDGKPLTIKTISVAGYDHPLRM
jgi:bis(5'-nucleosyl)-tetraphosphatase (symmetrical)